MIKRISVKKRLFIGLVVLTLGIGAGLYHWWQSEASTSAVSYGPRSSGVALGSQTTLETWQTTYFTTRVPTSLRKLSSSETPQSPLRAAYVFSGKGVHDSDQLAITIGSLSGGSLREISAIKLRLSQPDAYQQASRSFAPSGAVVFTGMKSYETAIFWQHDDEYVAVVGSGLQSDATDMDQAVADITTNWQWR